MASPGEEVPHDEGGFEPGTYDGPPSGEETDFEDEAIDPEDEGHGAPEGAVEGDEGDIEVDVVEGESGVAKRGTLKREANSLNHKLTHRYKNPYCDSCIRAKMKHFKTRRGAYKGELKKFGDLITFDAAGTSKVHQGRLKDRFNIVLKITFYTCFFHPFIIPVGMGKVSLLRTGSRALKRRHKSTPEQGEPLRHILWALCLFWLFVCVVSVCWRKV